MSYKLFKSTINTIVKYVIHDYNTNRIRLVSEIVGMICGVAAAILLAMTAPDPQLLICYCFWLCGSSILFACAISRGSTGLALSYAMYFIIDVVGFTRTVFL